MSEPEARGPKEHDARSESRAFARKACLDADAVLAKLASMAKQMPDAATAARDLARAQGLDAPVIERLAAWLIERGRECRRLLDLAT
jgi:hypothetical protein